MTKPLLRTLKFRNFDFPGYCNTNESIADIEGLLFDGAIDNLLSLPQEVSKVAEIQKGQASEIQKHELHLENLQVHIHTH